MTQGSFSVLMWHSSPSAEDYEEILNSAVMEVFWFDFSDHSNLMTCVTCRIVTATAVLFQVTQSFISLMPFAVSCAHTRSPLEALWSNIGAWTSKPSSCHQHTTGDGLRCHVHVWISLPGFMTLILSLQAVCCLRLSKCDFQWVSLSDFNCCCSLRNYYFFNCLFKM